MRFAQSGDKYMKDQRHILLWLQSLRGIAALLIVVCHSRLFLPDQWQQALSVDFFVPLAMGVDLFFMLSGFIMVVTTQDFCGGGQYAWRFLIKRFARIWPAYAVVSLLALIIQHHGFRAFTDKLSLVPFIESLFFIPVDPSVKVYFGMPLPVAWTLCFEFYFYLVLAVSMLFGAKRWLVVASWFVLTLVVAPLVRGTPFFDVAGQPPIFSWRYLNLVFNPVIWDFVFGLLIGWVYISSVRIKNTAVLKLALFGTFTLAIWAVAAGITTFHGPAGWGAPVALCMLTLALLSKEQDIRFPIWTIYLGASSYSLYLLHLLVFGVVERAGNHLKWLDPARLHTSYFLLAPAAAIILSIVFFSSVEKPVSRWARDTLLGKKA